MKSKQSSIRLFGQRSITSTFTNCPFNRNIDCKEDGKNKAKGADSSVSLSDFLNRRLHKSPVLPKSAQGKVKPFSTLLSGGKLKGPIEQVKDDKNREDLGVNCLLDVAFEQLKQNVKEKEDSSDLGISVEFGNSSSNGMQETRKRRNPFEGENGSQSSRKRLVVLGDDPKPKNTSRWKSFIDNEKPRRLYNHYANGSGWWDGSMEGVDSDEVGCKEMWEGVGSTTIGGLEWH